MNGKTYLLDLLENPPQKKAKKAKKKREPLPWTGEYDAELFQREVKFFFPGIPCTEVKAVVASFEKKQKRVNKGYVNRAVPLVLAYVRHTKTQYDVIIRETNNRSYAHAVVRRRCEHIMKQWGFVERKKLQVSMREAWKQEILRQKQS